MNIASTPPGSMTTAFLHPGLMGESLAANCRGTRLWVGEGRSEATRVRAESHQLTEVPDVATACAQADVVVSICPPAAASAVAAQVAQHGFTGLYCDANAISPDAAREIGSQFRHFVDGSVIGPPAHIAGTTRLYLSGARADEVAGLYDDSLVDARVIGDEAAAASALKMAYASWTKIGSALQLAVRALASAEGVEADLVAEWDISQPGLTERTERVAGAVGPKAWRFVGEMEQIASSFGARDLPSGFADAAADVYARMADFKGTESPDLDAVLDAVKRAAPHGTAPNGTT